MGHAADGTGRMRCSYKRATALVCAGNVIAALYVLHGLLGPLYFHPAHIVQPRIPMRNGMFMRYVVGYTMEEVERMREAHETRKSREPHDLMIRVQQMQQESSTVGPKVKATEVAKQRIAADVAQRLRELRGAANRAYQEEDGVIPGRPVPLQCHAEPHTDYDGVAVRWGLTHHTESAADCCQACLDQARTAKNGEMRCNIWVYCPAEEGCFSPDIYEHKQFECWLKQAETPHLNFKGQYGVDYRQAHPNAPMVVPWVSGLV